MVSGPRFTPQRLLDIGVADDLAHGAFGGEFDRRPGSGSVSPNEQVADTRDQNHKRRAPNRATNEVD